ncbi:unnamed protein product [Soboliphyme baturini]|uniref:Pentatricopeptide repeat-containing protein n=1 Tax=Soboliphyme baturini TaxID=241478 RepID=A0A183JAY2_9BILA|nr:unnamed protein product [Soboliphyme baturini]
MLMDLIADPINYGIFPDAFAANMVLDKFIETGNFEDAAKLSSFMMLQEEFSNKLLCWMTTYSCLKWLKSPEAKSQSSIVDKPQMTQEEDDEERVSEYVNEYVYMRVFIFAIQKDVSFCFQHQHIYRVQQQSSYCAILLYGKTRHLD